MADKADWKIIHHTMLATWILLTSPAHAQGVANIPSAYVPETNYKRLNCEALLRERRQAENELANMYAHLQTYQSRYFVDFLALGLPFATAGGNTVAAETIMEHGISHIKGELEAISLASNRRNCAKISAGPAGARPKP